MDDKPSNLMENGKWFNESGQPERARFYLQLAICQSLIDLTKELQRAADLLSTISHTLQERLNG
jgi:hypothetical protein